MRKNILLVLSALEFFTSGLIFGTKIETAALPTVAEMALIGLGACFLLCGTLFTVIAVDKSILMKGE